MASEKLDINDHVLELRSALDKATAATDILSSHYFLSSEPDMKALAIDYRMYQHLSFIISDLITEAVANLNKIESIAGNEGIAV